MSLIDYMRHFQLLIEFLEHYNATIGEDKAFLDKAGILTNDVKPYGKESD